MGGAGGGPSTKASRSTRIRCALALCSCLVCAVSIFGPITPRAGATRGPSSVCAARVLEPHNDLGCVQGVLTLVYGGRASLVVGRWWRVAGVGELVRGGRKTIIRTDVLFCNPPRRTNKANGQKKNGGGDKTTRKSYKRKLLQQQQLQQQEQEQEQQQGG